MANNRDVKLTISAKDDASAIIKKVTEALAKYGSGQDEVSRKIAPIGEKFRRLSDEVTGLQRSMTKAKGQVALTSQFNILTGALAKASDEYRKSSAAIEENSAALAASKASVESVTAARNKTREVLREEKAELAAATSAITRNTKGMKEAKDAVAKYGTEIAQKQEALSKYTANLSRASEAQAKARSEDEKAARTVDVLTERLAELRAERERQRRDLAGGRGSITADYNSAAKVAARAPSTLPGSFTQTAASSASVMMGNLEGDARGRIAGYDAEIARLEKLQTVAKSTSQQSSVALRNASASVAGIESDIRKVYSLKAAQDKLAEARAKLEQTTLALDKATKAQARLSKSTAENEAALREYNAAVQLSTNEVQKLEAEGRKYAASMESATKTTQAAESAIAELNQSAKAGGLSVIGDDAEKAERRLKMLEERLEKTAQMSGRLAKYSDGAGNITTSDDAAKLRNLNAQLTETKNDAAQFRAELTRLKNELGTTTSNSKRAKDEIKNFAQALNAAETDARRLNESIRKIGLDSGTQQRGLYETWRKHNAETRTALSIQQRLRGQILSTIAAYGGLYGVANLIRGVTEAFMQQEAAMSRLGVVFDGNQQRMSTELGWIRREAERLGIQFGVLADEYTKFAVAGKTSGFSEDSIRTIFTSVSESARVNKLGLEDIKGIYLALSQMISKGKISAEELRQQLGERLPGAMKLMADAMGVTVAELDDMMKKGEALATEENLLKFAETLDKTFGAQLPAALRMFTAEWGRLQNTIYKSRLNIGKGGLIDGLTEVMKTLNEYGNSKEGVEFFMALGNAMGDIVKVIPTLLENMELIVDILKILITIPIISFFARWFQSVKVLGAALVASFVALRGAPAAMGAFTAAVAGSTGAMATGTVVARGFAGALATLGPIIAGIAVAGVLFSTMGSWADGVDKITAAQAEHERVMDQILAKYEEAKGKTYEWTAAITERNRVELAGSLKGNEDAFGESKNRLRDIVLGRDKLTGNVVKDFMDSVFGEIDSAGNSMILSDLLAEQFGIDSELAATLKEQWRKVTYDINAASKEDLMALKKTLLEFASAVPDTDVKNDFLDIAKQIDEVIQTGNNLSLTITTMRELGDAVADTEGVVSAFPITVKEAADGVSELTDEMDKFETAASERFIRPLEEAIEKAGGFKTGLTALDLEKTMTDPFTGATKSIGDMLIQLAMLKSALPTLASAFEEFANGASLEKLAGALSWMNNIPLLSGLFQNIIGGELGGMLRQDGQTTQDFTTGVGSPKGKQLEAIVTESARVAAQLGVSVKDLITVIGYETGGTFDPWQKGGAGGAYRGLIQWSPDNQKTYNLNEGSSIGEQADAIGKYLYDRGVRPGMGILQIYAAINAGNVNRVNASDANNGGAPGTVTDKVNSKVMADHSANAEALLKLYGNMAEYGQYAGNEARRNQDEADKAREKAAEEAAKAAEDRAAENTDIEENLRLQQMRVDGKEREAFIQEKINAYVEKHGQLSAEENARLSEQYGKMYDLQNLKSQDEQTQEKIKKHQEEINRLEAERNALMEQREIFAEQGNAEQVAAIDEQLVGVNAKLTAAIASFREFWAASNSPDAAAGIAQLDAMEMKLDKVQKTALITAQQINEKWAQGISNAFSSFAKAIANGENAVEAFRNAFLQFAADFLIEIGQMIIKQTILNMLQGSGGGGGFGGMILKGLGGITSGIFHTGKGPGQVMGNTSRKVSPALFANAPRFHQGKLPGLRTGEMAAIIKEDEEVIPQSDPRHAWNNDGEDMGDRQGRQDGTLVANFFDPVSFMESGLAKAAGKRIMMNFVNANSTEFKRALES